MSRRKYPGGRWWVADHRLRVLTHARHSTITLTTYRYGHLEVLDRRQALDVLADVTESPPAAAVEVRTAADLQQVRLTTMLSWHPAWRFTTENRRAQWTAAERRAETLPWP
jgi:hypothetical protein